MRNIILVAVLLVVAAIVGFSVLQADTVQSLELGNDSALTNYYRIQAQHRALVGEPAHGLVNCTVLGATFPDEAFLASAFHRVGAIDTVIVCVCNGVDWRPLFDVGVCPELPAFPG